MNYYIADTHFGHANIIKHCGRPFETVEDISSVVSYSCYDVVRVRCPVLIDNTR